MANQIYYAVSPESLKAISREATADHLRHGTDLTDAVVKAASLYDQPLTSEHVRRICEMTYHDTFERKFREKTAGADRYISFDPPDPVAAARRLQSAKVASAHRPRETRVNTVTASVQKVASAVSGRRNSPVNAFDELIKQASPEDPSKIRWYNPMSEVIQEREQIKNAIQELSVKKASLENAESFAFLELAGQAYQQYKEGSSVSDILRACVEPLDNSKYASAVVSDVLDELLRRLENEGCVFSNEKIASSARVNPNHPLPVKFSKVASSRNERVHLEYALSDLQAEFARVNEEIRELCS
jgi:hypothetical protein